MGRGSLGKKGGKLVEVFLAEIVAEVLELESMGEGQHEGVIGRAGR